jgi:hypothetical protein
MHEKKLTESIAISSVRKLFTATRVLFKYCVGPVTQYLCAERVWSDLQQKQVANCTLGSLVCNM